jgi:hypothetical protein
LGLGAATGCMKFFVESPYPDVLKKLLADGAIQRARLMCGVGAPGPLDSAGGAAGVSTSGAGGGGAGGSSTTGFIASQAPKDTAAIELAAAGVDVEQQVAGTADDEERELLSFEIDSTQVCVVWVSRFQRPRRKVSQSVAYSPIRCRRHSAPEWYGVAENPLSERDSLPFSLG